MLQGLNHLTLAVSDLASSLAFYQQLPGMRLHASWDSGAYLSCGALWLCGLVHPWLRFALEVLWCWQALAMRCLRDESRNVYRALKETGNIGMASAAGLYQSVVGFILVLSSNFVVRKIDRDSALF